MKVSINTALVCTLLCGINVVSAGSIQMNVSGLQCEGCAANIASNLRALPAISATSVDLSSHTFSVQLRNGADVSDAKLREVVTVAGYNVASIARSAGPMAVPAPKAAHDAEVRSLRRWVLLLSVLSSALVFVIAFPWLKRTAAKLTRSTKLDSGAPSATRSLLPRLR